MRRRTANDRAPFGKQHRQLRFDVALSPRLGLVRPDESGRVGGSASIANIAVLRTLRVELRVSGLSHAALRPFDPRLAFRHKPFDSALRHSLRRGDDDIRVRRFDAQVHVFDGFAHDGHPHAGDARRRFGNHAIAVAMPHSPAVTAVTAVALPVCHACIMPRHADDTAALDFPCDSSIISIRCVQDTASWARSSGG